MAAGVLPLRAWRFLGPSAALLFSLQEAFVADPEGVTSLSWNTTPLEAAMIAVGGMSKKVSLFVLNATRGKWECIKQLSVDHRVHDVAWAPNLGRCVSHFLWWSCPVADSV